MTSAGAEGRPRVAVGALRRRLVLTSWERRSAPNSRSGWAKLGSVARLTARTKANSPMGSYWSRSSGLPRRRRYRLSPKSTTSPGMTYFAPDTGTAVVPLLCDDLLLRASAQAAGRNYQPAPA